MTKIEKTIEQLSVANSYMKALSSEYDSLTRRFNELQDEIIDTQRSLDPIGGKVSDELLDECELLEIQLEAHSKIRNAIEKIFVR